MTDRTPILKTMADCIASAKRGEKYTKEAVERRGGDPTPEEIAERAAIEREKWDACRWAREEAWSVVHVDMEGTAVKADRREGRT